MPTYQVSKFQSRPINTCGLTSRINGSTSVLQTRWHTSRQQFYSRGKSALRFRYVATSIAVQTLMMFLITVRWNVWFKKDAAQFYNNLRGTHVCMFLQILSLQTLWTVLHQTYNNLTILSLAKTTPSDVSVEYLCSPLPAVCLVIVLYV